MQKKPFEISVEPPGAIITPQRKSVLYWRVFKERMALPNYADEQALTAIYITVGRSPRLVRRPVIKLEREDSEILGGTGETLSGDLRGVKEVLNHSPMNYSETPKSNRVIFALSGKIYLAKSCLSKSITLVIDFGGAS